jgi:hypothetical protein
MGFSKFASYMKSIDEYGSSTYDLISEAMKYLVARWMLEVPNGKPRSVNEGTKTEKKRHTINPYVIPIPY